MDKQITSFKDDLLDRKNIAINLTNIIKNKSDLSVLAIDSKWGSGKTTFVTMWQDMIKTDTSLGYNEEFKTIYFNAWENDYIEEPLLSLLNEIQKQILESKGDCQQRGAKIIEKVKPLGKVVGQVALQHATKGVLKSFDFNSNLEKSLEELTNKLGDLAIENLNNKKKTRIVIKESLEEFQKDFGEKVIIFIDELDRCRPTFAVELLETIKHIFDVENYIFVISLDKDQLAHSIKTLYGQEMDSDGYLRRFFDLEYAIPQNNLRDYIKYKNKVICAKYNNTECITKYLEEIFCYESYTLRDLDKVYNYIDVMLPMYEILNEENLKQNLIVNVSISAIISYFINLKFKHQNIFNTMEMKKYNEIYEDIIPEEIGSLPMGLIDWEFSLVKKGDAGQVVIKSIIAFLNLYRKSNYDRRCLSDEDIYSSSYVINENLKSYKINKKISVATYFNKINIFEKMMFIENFNIEK